MNRVEMIEKSLLCLKLGWASFIPGFGLVFSVLAIRSCCLVMLRGADSWNPARWHLLGGGLLGVFMLLAHAVAITLLLHA